jgi:plastocyanin
VTATQLAVLLVTQAHLVLTSAFAAQLTALVRDDGGKPLPDAVVLAYPEDARAVSPKSGEEVVDQVDKEFVPYVKAVRVGSVVQFPNKDNIRHHVYSFSAAKPFELPLYSGTPAKPVLFDKVGIVKLGCNIHDWMLGYIYVTDAPYFTQSGGDGRAILDQLPGKRYRLRVWHPRMEIPEDKTLKQVDLSDETQVTVEWKLKLKAEFRPRRVPLPGEPGYR